jgi:putative ABC transport system permease protein
MRFKDLLKLSLRMFKTRPSRTWLTILGMGVGSGAVLFLIGLGYGLQNLLLEQIVTSDTLLSLTISSAQPEVIILDEERIQRMKEIEGVKDIAPLISFPAQLSIGTLIGNVVLKGVDPQYFKYEGIFPKEGELFEDEEPGIVVSEAVLQLFNIGDPKEIIGKNFEIQIFAPRSIEEGIKEVRPIKLSNRYKVSGIVEGLESVFIYFPLSELKKEVKINEYELAKIRVETKEDLERIREEIIGQGFQVSSLSETIDQANKIFRGIQVALGFFGAIALVVAAIGMVNTMTVTLLERTQEIGIMRAIGASKKDVLTLFITEATMMGFFGGIAGLIIGTIGGKLFNLGVNFLASIFGGKPINLFYYPLWFIITLVVVSTFVGLITGFFPGRRAAKLDPLEALRYK